MNREKSKTLWWTKSKEKVVKSLESSLQKGLTQQTAEKRLQTVGPNSLPEQKPVSALSVLVEQFTSLIVWILIIAAVIAGFLGEWIDAIAIIAIVIINGILGFVQEFRSIRSMEALIKLTHPTSKVIRDGTLMSLPSEEIVPGDLILLEAGDKVPADGRIVKNSLLNMQEAALTGESATVAKNIDPIEDPELLLGDRANMVFQGTTVASGKGYFIVTETGQKTELGKIAKLLESIDDKETPLQRRLSELGKRLVYLCLLIVGLIFVIGELRGYDPFDMLMTALSLAVAAIPEGLPAVVTIALAIGMQKMVRRNALVRKLSAVETLGCTTVICSDKTGTLTENKMRVHSVWANQEVITMTGDAYEPKGQFELEGKAVDVSSHSELIKLLEIVSLCNNANLNKVDGHWEITGDPTEGALLVAAQLAGVSADRELVQDEDPFDSKRKLMSVLIEGQLCLKGAPDILLERSKSILLYGKETAITPDIITEVENAIHQLASQGLRVLGGAYRPIENTKSIDPSMEQDLVFVGLAAMRDPPRQEVKDAIKKCRLAGIRPVMVTGDHMETAVAIAKELDILRDGTAIDGKQLKMMSKEELYDQVEEISVYSRVSPNHKMRIIESLRERGHVAAMTGDGVNDAPAVDDADIGVAMGITGTDVTKGVSDMVILDDNFSTIVHAIEEGRGIYDNIVKFTSYLFSCNLAEVLIIFISLFFLTTDAQGQAMVILAPVHLLWINLVTDGLPAIALALDPPSKDVMTIPPREPKAPIFSLDWGLRLSTLSLLICFITLGAFYYVYEADPYRARATAFTMLVMLELSKAFILRARYRIGILDNPYLIGAVGLSFLLQLAIIYLPIFQLPLKTAPLAMSEWGLIAGGLALQWVLAYPIIRTAK